MNRYQSGAIAFSICLFSLFSCSPDADAGTAIESGNTKGTSTSSTAISMKIPAFDPTLTRIPAHIDMTALPVLQLPLPEKAIARLGAGRVDAAAIAQDWSQSAFFINQKLVVCDQDACRILNEAAAEEDITEIAFSHNGKKMATLGKHFTLWDAETGGKIISSPTEGWYTAVAFSPDDKTIAASARADIFLFDGESGENIAKISAGGPDDVVWDLAFSPDGKTLASGMIDNTATVWDTGSRTVSYSLKTAEHYVTSVCFSPDGKRLATGTDMGSVQVWDTESKSELLTLKGTEDWIVSLVFSPNGELLASAGQNTILWDAEKGTSLHTLESGQTASAVFSPDGKVFSAVSDTGTLRFWDVSSGELAYTVDTIEGILGAVNDIAVSPDGKYFASVSKKTVLWDAMANQELLILEEMVGDSVAFSADSSTLAVGSRGGTIDLWDIQSGKHLLTMKGHKYSVESVAYSPDGTRLASASYDGTVIMWNPADGQKIYTLSVCETCDLGVTDVAFSPDGRWLAIGVSDDSVWQCDAETGNPVYTHTVEWVGDTTVYTVSVAFSPDGTVLASGSTDNVIRTWDASTGEDLGGYNHESNNGIHSISLSPDGKYFAVASDTQIIVFDFSVGNILQVLEGHDIRISSVVFSADGKTLLSASYDGTIIVWDVSRF